MTPHSADDFLGGRLRLYQPVDGYRAGADPVFLAAAVEARPGDTVLELGCGVGTVLYCLMTRVPDLQVTGVEREEAQAELARRNGIENGLAARIVHADIAQLPQDLASQSFDHVVFNPPFFDRTSGSISPNASREAGRGQADGLALWIDVALRRLRPKGRLTVILRTGQLPDVLADLGARAGDLRVLPLQPRPNRPSKLVILSGRKGARGPFSLLPPFLLHEGPQHLDDGDSYTEAAQAVLRQAAPLSTIVNG